jgi:hypothetical protein
VRYAPALIDRQAFPRGWSVRQFSVFCLAAGIAAALVGPASGGKAGLSGNLCTTVPKGALVALKVTAPCINQKPLVSVQATPLGSVRTVAYRARWGTGGGTVSQPRTYFAAQAIYVQGASAAVAYAQKHFRAEVLAHGIPISSHPLATEDAETAACHNPPIDDCTKATILALVGQYGLSVYFGGPAPFLKPDDPQNPAVDEANDQAQENAVKKSFVAAAKSVIAALG